MKNPVVAKYLLDTNVILEGFWGVEPSAGLVKKWIKAGNIAISSISTAEIYAKASKDESEKLGLLISRFGVLPVDEVVAQTAGKYRLQFSRKKKRVYLLNCLIAATAKLYNLVLVTHNAKDYPMKDIEVLAPGK